MQNVFNSIAVLSLLGVVLLLFASSALLKLVRELQAGLVEARATGGSFGFADAMVMPEFAASDGSPTYVAVIDAGCPACRDRAADLVELSCDYQGGHLAALTKDPACADWLAGSDVRTVVDPAVLGRVGVGVTPMLLKYAPDGTEQWRRVIGSRQDLQSLLNATSPGQDDPADRSDAGELAHRA